MEREEAQHIEEAFKREQQTVQQVMGARGMEYLWRGRRYSDVQRVNEAIRLHVYSNSSDQQVGVPITGASARPGLGSGTSGLLFGIAGALLSGAVVVGLEALVVVLLEGLFGGHVVPRGLGWIALPILAMVAGFRFGPIIADVVAAKTADTIKITEIRYVMAGSAFWVIAVGLYVLMFSPFGYYMRERDYWTVAKVISFPVILAIVGLAIVGWLRKNEVPKQ